MQTLLIRNATIINEGRRSTGSLLISDQHIHTIFPEHAVPPSASQTIDASGCYLIPGVIDDQVHFREPGLTHKGDIASESRAAVAGGITSYMDMPNTRPPTLDSARLEEKYQLANGRSFANYGFYLGASNDNIEAVKAVDPNTV